MKNSQVISIGGSNKDSILSFDDLSVIAEAIGDIAIDQLPLGSVLAKSTLYVDIYFMDLMSVSSFNVTDVEMNYQSDVRQWTVSIEASHIDHFFTDKHKYVGFVKDHTGSNDPVMRGFSILEFCVDNDSFEDTWMNLPYQVIIGETTSYIYWYNKNDSNFGGAPLFQAPVYQGGEGTDYATSAANITHRGAIIPYA
jgi:hypothetical protein